MTNQDTSSPNDPNQKAFIPEDLFERTKIAEKIFRILQNEIEENNNQEYNSNLDSFFPMLVDGNWGTGKTVFCHRLENYINNHCPSENYKHIQTIYIDAFEYDHTDNPLFVLLSKIIQYLKDKDDRNQADKINIITNSARKVLWPVAKSIAKAGGLAIIEALVTSLVAELPNEDELGNTLTKESIKNIGNTVQQRIEKLFQKEESESQSIAALKQALSDYAAENPLVIFIDELDRCKPAFALDMLEVIKHIFDIPNVKFILFTFERQLEESIKHRYGQHIDSQRYLDKFIKFRIQLPTQISLPGIPASGIISNTHQYIKNLINSTLFNNIPKNGNAEFNNFLRFMISLHNISLRNAETIIRYFNFYVKTKRINSLTIDLAILLFYCIILYVIDPNLCIRVYNKKATVQEVSSFLGIEEQSNNNRLLHSELESIPIRRVLTLITMYPNYNQMQEFIDFLTKRSLLDWVSMDKTASLLDQGYVLLHFKEKDDIVTRFSVNKIEELISDIAFY
ncbi:KAP family P-loop NTPase fold protein [Cardiobacterium valvarum]|uniref:p-loop domain protein, KAP family n=1 Tax=Cardiobacterium valvarum F0432 TaxID=797473 RepID=G9ZG52_9GAMM|nr:P-loop domain protein, KAP family [Cardiobacterium valvarum]EHM53408.1 P-loop domain protein, KAP family [Cardiobacterium valvarum F0432]